MHLHLLKTVMEFRVLGPLAVHAAGRAIDVGASKERILLALLLLRPNETVSVDRLVDALWTNDPPSSARNAVQVYVSRLRKILPVNRIESDPGGYSLAVASDELDLARFRVFVQEGRRARSRGDAELAAERLRAALALWRGSPLPELEGNQLFRVEIARLEEERLSALEERIEADLELDLHADVVPELESLVAANPLRERLLALLMLALYRSERQAEALGVYRTARRRLVDELGLEPGSALSELHQQILVQDERLRPARRISGRGSFVPPSRRRVTLLLADLSLPERLDPEVAARVLTRARAAIRDVLEEHGAVVDTPLGDTVVAVFGLPRASEDDPLRALRAAADLPATVSATTIELRIAIDTGDVLASEDRVLDEQVAGWMMKLKEGAAAGETVIGEATRKLVRSLVEVRGSKVEGAWNVLAFDPAGEAIERQFDAPLVGRHAEIERLTESFSWVERTETSHLVTLIGPAGIGKSRLGRELAEQVSPQATVVVGRCLSYGSGTFRPLAEVVRQAAGDVTRVALERVLEGVDDARLIIDQLTAALGTEEGSNAEDAFWAFRKLFSVLARERPLVLVLEDLHWAEERLLDFVEELVQREGDSAILVLCLARPELLDFRPTWGGGRLDAESIRLEPLSERSSEALISSLEREVPEDTRRRIVRRSEGNPLFIEQMVALLAEDPDAAVNAIPPSIQGVLAARVDRLSAEERSLLECASVVGLEFSLDAVADLSPDSERSRIADLAGRLVGRELLRPVGPELRGGETFRFKHILIRDVVYDSVLKSRRAELHERFARWLEAGDRVSEIEEIIGYHLERAYQFRAELDPDDERLEGLAAEAGALLASAGRRELERSDMPAAIETLTRAALLLAADAPSRGDLLADLAHAHRLTGEWHLARKYLEEGLKLASERKDEALRAYLRVSEIQLRLHTEPDFSVNDFLDGGSRVLAAIELPATNEYVARVRMALAWPHALRGEACIAEELIWAVPAKPELLLQAKKLLPSLWLYGPLTVEAAAEKCEALLREDPPPRTSASCYRCLAVLNAMKGDFEEARALLHRDRIILEQLGLTVVLAAGASLVAGEVELLAGDSSAAEDVLRRGIKRLEGLGRTMHFSAVAALLARALFEQGKISEARSMTEIAEEGPSHDVATKVGWRGVRAMLLCREGHQDEAKVTACEALRIAETSDSFDLQGTAFADLADVQLTLGNYAEARTALASAVGRFEMKGNLVSAARLRSR